MADYPDFTPVRWRKFWLMTALVALHLAGLAILLNWLPFDRLPSATSPTDADALLVPDAVEARPFLPPPVIPPAPPASNLQPAPPQTVQKPPVAAESPETEPAVPQAPPTPPTVAWLGMEITQGVQVFNQPEHPRCNPDPAAIDHVFCNNSMPLVAGRHTLIRAYPACRGDCPAKDILVQLRILKNGQEQAVLTRQFPAATLQQTQSLALADVRYRLENSVNFEFIPPPAWMEGDITFELSIPASVSEGATLNLTRNFAVRKTLRVAYLPLQYDGLTPPDSADAAYWLLRMYPVPDVEYYRLPVPDVTLDNGLSKGAVLRKLLFTYWLYVQHQPVAQWPDQLFGWLPQELFNGGVSDPFWCPNCAGPHSSRVAFGGLRPEMDIGAPRILVHEIAHNLGAQHAWSPTQQEDELCFKAEGADIRVDPEWPYSETPYIQEFGIDLYSDPPVIYPPAYYDVMAYCARPWISPHTYRKLFDSPFLQPNANLASLSLPDFQFETEETGSGTLLVSGVIYPNGTVAQPEIVRLEGAFANAAASFTPPDTTPTGDDYCLNILGADNSVLAERCFDAGFEDMETGEPLDSSTFFFTLPEVPFEQVGRVTVSKDEQIMADVSPSNSPPTVRLTYPAGGETLFNRQTITWQADDADGDDLVFDLYYSADGGQRWLPLAIRLRATEYTIYTDQLPAGSQGLVRVVATDGFHTATSQSERPFAIAPPLENSLSLRGPALVEPGQTFEVEIVANSVTTLDLSGFHFNFDYDPTLVQALDLQLHPDLADSTIYAIKNGTGQISVMARSGRVDSLTDSVSLATVTMQTTVQTGPVHLSLSDVQTETGDNWTVVQALTVFNAENSVETGDYSPQSVTERD